MTSTTLVALTTCRDREEADRLAQALIGKRLAACVNIVPDVRSIYRWGGDIEEGQEVLLLIKTSEARFDALEKTIQTMSSYELPELLAVTVSSGSADYLNWVGASLEDTET